MKELELYRLLTWSSPGYPTGAFVYSHGLEWAVESGQVRGAEALLEYVSAVLARGGGWIDAVFFVHAWRAAESAARFDEIARWAAAFRGGAETATESRQQGAAFLAVTRKAWPHPLLEAFARRHARAPVAACVVVALASAAHGIELGPSVHAYLHAFAANLVCAGTKLIPLGQSEAQIVVARLAPVIAEVGSRARQTALEDLGTAAPGLELCSFLHETQYSRLFRS